MKTFKFLNKKLTIKFEEVKEPENLGKKKVFDDEIKDKFTFRVVVLIFLLTLISFVGKLNFFEHKYKEGDIAKKDIVSTVYTTYRDEDQKTEIIKNVVSSSAKIYRREEKVEGKIVESVDNYFKLILNMDSKISDDDLSAFITETGVVIPMTDMKKLISMKKEAKLELKNKIVTILKALANRGIKEEELYYTKKLISNIDENLTQFEKDLIVEFIEPNEFYDEKATIENRKEKIENLDDIVVKINPGDIIVKKGQEIRNSDIKKLKQLGLYSPFYSLQIVAGFLLYFLVVAVLFYMSSRNYIKNEIEQKKYYYATILILVSMSLFARVIPMKMMYLFPFGAVVLLLGIIASERYAIFMSGIAILFLFANQGFDYIFLLLNVIDLFVGIYYIKRVKNRSDIINAGIVMGIMKTVMILSLDMIIKKDILESIINIMETLASGFFAGMITVAVLPYLENTFNILTNIKLIELSDFSNPLLRELMVKAPGTFHHSILVSTIAENAAEAVGANSIFTRVATYYHDIGKTKRPNFYVENQFAGVNPHENLNPYLSTLVISSHTSDGEEMAKKYKIPKEIRDIMREHQGTTLLAYFYNKAKKENPDVNEMDFRYEGPKPKSKESAIIMLADSVEAAVRSINEKERNPITIENMVRQIVKAKIDDGQLSDAELTFKDIETVIQSFTKVLQGIYHVRLKYPDLKKSGPKKN